MKKLIILGILIFIVSIGVGYICSDFFVGYKGKEANFLENNMVEETLINGIDLKTVEAVSEEEKVLPNTEFGLKTYYDECNHFNFEYTDLPKDLINMTRQEIEDYYDNEYEIEKFENNSLIISKEINGLCDNHFFVKLGNEHIEIFRLNTDGSFSLYKETDISKDYLPAEDIEKLEEGIYIYR